MRRSHVIKNVKRQAVEGFFNAAYVADGNEQQQLKPANQTVRVQAKHDYAIREQEIVSEQIYGISKVSSSIHGVFLRKRLYLRRTVVIAGG